MSRAGAAIGLDYNQAQEKLKHCPNLPPHPAGSKGGCGDRMRVLDLFAGCLREAEDNATAQFRLKFYPPAPVGAAAAAAAAPAFPFSAETLIRDSEQSVCASASFCCTLLRSAGPVLSRPSLPPPKQQQQQQHLQQHRQQ